MHPEGTRRREGNNASCVIRIEAGGGQRVLLTGDIESASEQVLLRDLQEQLRAEVVIAPHHGSLTSSSRAFVGAVNPDYALFPVGYRNRYRFPRAEVVDRYRAAGAEIYNTARHGAITLRLPADDRAIEIASWRCANPRFWRQPNNRFGWCDK
jgi:competence protein ComEC